MIKKEHDWFLENLINSDFTNSEFKTVGINAENTSLQDADFYKNNPKIREHFTKNGNFNELEFNQMYQKAIISYNELANDTWHDDIEQNLIYSEHNIFVDPEKRRKTTNTLIDFGGMPFINNREYTSSMSALGEFTPTDRSVEEIAQTQEVFDPETNKWSASPNDAFFDDFFETRVLASWDYDADIYGNPTDDISKIAFYKGDIKLNSAGLPYYENLNGRSVVGKTVLHKSDILTTDGSFWNKFDIFDSDDIETPVYKTVLKNVAMAAPLLAAPLGLPIVANLYLGAGIALSLADVFNTATKMVLGSEVDSLNNVEGFIDSLQLSPAKTEAKSFWNLNSLVDLAGQVFLQLSQQRWIFKYAPAIFSGTTNAEKIQTNNINKLKDKLLAELETSDLKDVKWLAKMQDEMALLGARAQRMTQDQIQAFNKLGEEISRLYMTGIVAAEGYNQAKASGLSDLEATAFTLGYGLFEYGILKSDIGKWILPELKTDKQALNKALQVMASPIIKSGAVKNKSVNKTFTDWLKIGLQKASIDDRIGKSMGQFAIANALSEGIEETTEELLLDFTKGLFNVYANLTGDESRFKLFENWQERYTMSFFGGMLGGGLFSLTPDVKKAYEGIRDMSIPQANTEILSRIRNGEADDVYKAIDNNIWGNKYLSYIPSVSQDQEVIYEASDVANSQDTLIKTVLYNTVKNMETMLQMNGANITDDRLIDIIDDFKFIKIAETSTSERFINDFSTELSELYSKQVELQNKLKPLNRPKDDAPEAEIKAFEKSINTLQKEIDTHSSNIQKFIKGEMSAEYILDAMFESQNILSREFIPDFVSYLQYNKINIKQLSKDDLNKHLSNYSSFIKTNRADNVHKYREIFDFIIEKVSPNLTTDFISDISQSSKLAQLLKERIASVEIHSKENPKNYVNDLYNVALSSLIDSYYGEDTYHNLIAPYIEQRLELEKQLSLPETTLEQKENIINEIGDINRNVESVVYNQINNIDALNLSLLGLNETTKNILYKALKQFEVGEGDNFSNIKKLIESAPTTGGTKLLKNIQTSLNSELDINELVTLLDREILSKKDLIEEIKFDDEIMSQIDDAIKFIGIAQAALYAHRNETLVNKEQDLIFGYNTIKNQLLDTNLPVIDSTIVDPVVKELEQLKAHLQFLLQLSNLNKNRKLKIQKHTSINTVRLLSKKTQKLCRLLTNWNNKELEEALQSADLILNSDSFDQIDEIEFEKQRNKIETAIHNLFQNNLDKLDELIPIFRDKFNLLSITGDPITDISNDIDDVSFFWYIASLTCTNPNDYNAKYKSILNGKFAPLITQEVAAFIGYSQLTNKELFGKFVDIKNNIIENYNGPDISGVIDKKFTKDSTLYTRFGDIVLIEGVPGAGKTTTTTYIIVNMLGKDHELLKNVCWISPNKAALNEDGKSKAEASALDAGLTIENPTTQILTREEVLNKYFPNYLDKFTVTETTQVLKDPSELKEIDGIFKIQNIEQNTSAELPSLFIIDEISLWSTFDVDTISSLGVPILVMGDLQQTPLTGTINVDGAYIRAQIYRGNFINTPKIGISMRTSNKPLSDSLLSIRQSISHLEAGYQIKTIPTTYYEDAHNFVGVKIVDADETDEIKRIIQKMNKLKSKSSKIGTISLDRESSQELFDTLYKEPFAPSLQDYEGVTSSGVESDYFVVYVDANNYIDINRLKQLYTGVSRTIKGTLLIINGESDFTSNQAEFLQQEGYSAEEIKKFSDDRLNVLNAVYTQNPAQTQDSSQTPTQDSTQEQPQSSPQTPVPGPNPIVSTDDTVITDEETINENTTTKYPKPETVEMAAYTSMDNNLTYEPHYSGDRIDGLFGLQKLLPGDSNDVNRYKKLIKAYFRIKSACKYDDSIEKLQESIASELNLKNCSVKIGIKSSVANANNKHPRFTYSPNDRVSEIHNPKGSTAIPDQHKYITVVVSENGSPVLEMPLYRINNWVSYIGLSNNTYTNEVFKNLLSAVNIPPQRFRDVDRVIRDLEKLDINKEKNPQLYNLLSLLKIWNTNTDFIMYLEPEQANMFLADRKNTGPFIVSSKIPKGENIEGFTPELTNLNTLMRSNQFVMSDVYIHTNTNNLGINVGKPFIIISDDTTLNKSDLYNLYEKGEFKDRLTLVYLTLPSLGISEYLQYKHAVRNREVQYVSQFGTHTTDIKLLYHFLNNLFKTNENSSEIAEDITYNKGKEIFNIISDIYSQFWDMNGKRKSGVTTEDILNKLFETNEELVRLTGSAKGSSISLCATNALINAFELINTSNIKNLENILKNLKNQFPYGIFVNLKVKKSDSGSSLREVVNINPDYTITIDVVKNNEASEEKFEIKMFGKIDPTRILADWTPFFNIFNSKAPDSNGEYRTDSDYLHYIGELTDDSPITPKNNILEFYINNISDEGIRQKLSPHATETVNSEEEAFEKILDYLSEDYYLIELNGKLMAIQFDKKVSRDEYIDGVYYFYNGDELIYKGTYSNGKLDISEQQINEQVESLTSIQLIMELVDNMKITTNYESVRNELGSLIPAIMDDNHVLNSFEKELILRYFKDYFDFSDSITQQLENILKNTSNNENNTTFCSINPNIIQLF